MIDGIVIVQCGESFDEMIKNRGDLNMKWSKLYALRYAADQKYEAAMQGKDLRSVPLFLLMFNNMLDVLKPEYAEELEGLNMLVNDVIKESSLKWRFQYFAEPFSYFVDFKISPPWKFDLNI